MYWVPKHRRTQMSEVSSVSAYWKDDQTDNGAWKLDEGPYLSGTISEEPRPAGIEGVGEHENHCDD